MLINNYNQTKIIVNEISFDFLPIEMSRDLKSSIEFGISNDVKFLSSYDSLSIFRNAVAQAITDIEERGVILCRFLKNGPYWEDGEIPVKYSNLCLSDEETRKAISFIYGHMVNSFQGQLAELLAIKPCVALIKNLSLHKRPLTEASLFIGDSILPARIKKRGFSKGADFHIIKFNKERDTAYVYGVVEVKSYCCSRKRLQKQLLNHVARVKNGFSVMGRYYSQKNILLGNSKKGELLQISVIPSSWHLSREFSWEKEDGKSYLKVKEEIPNSENIVKQTGENEWSIILRWSCEAIAQVAYELTFWYMGKLGERIFIEELPSGIKNMTPLEAGLNAAKEMLYFSINRCNSSKDLQRAIALYNTYCFGYSLGMNYRNKKGIREMLFIEALEEIEEHGIDKHKCKIWK